MKNYEFIAVIIIFVVLLTIILIGGQLNKNEDIQNTYNVGNITENQIKDGIKLEIDGDEVQKIYPFTGAYPSDELAYLTKLKNVDRKNMTNEFILRTGFAKVTKEDWAESYTKEGAPLEIDAKILEEYIEDIFGNVEYKHADFSNTDIELDNSNTSLYENKYNEKTDTYTINVNAGDGVGDSYVETYNLTATQYGDKIEIVVNPIYIDNLGEKKNKDGQYNFYYKCYSSYNFKTKKFENELTGEIEETIYDFSNNGELEFIEEIKNISIEDLETYILTYKLNGKTNEFEFESLKFEE